MNTDHTPSFDGTERELLAKTRELDEMHHDVAIPAMREGVVAMIDAAEADRGAMRATSRRTFLFGAGAAIAGAATLLSVPTLAGAISRGATQSDVTHPRLFPPKGLTGDLAVAAVAASLENLAVFTYTAGLGVASAGKLGTVPPAVATFATTARAQHADHAKAWNSVLRAHAKARVTETNPTLTPVVKSDFAVVSDVTGLLKLALTLETIAAETYQAETSRLKSSAAIGLSASIEPVEMQHIAVLYYVLGEYPGAQNAAGQPLAFSSTAKAV